VLIACLVAIPLLQIISSVGQSSDGTWQHLQETVLPGYLWNTLVLALSVGLLTTIIGVGTAWLVTSCRFPGSGILEWALLLPLAIPSYLLAYAATDVLQFSGPVQTLLRNTFDWSRADYWFPNARSLPGASVILSVNLYPYVYLASRAAFLEQSACVREMSRTLGLGSWQSFFRVSLPMARPSRRGGKKNEEEACKESGASTQ
jgi:iron(III) transport system permease protein